MPNKPAAKKYIRASKRRYQRNLKVKKDLKNVVKKLEDAFKKGEGEKKIRALLHDAVKTLDKAAQKKVIKKNKASRKKGRLAKKVNFFLKEKKVK